MRWIVFSLFSSLVSGLSDLARLQVQQTLADGASSMSVVQGGSFKVPQPHDLQRNGACAPLPRVHGEDTQPPDLLVLRYSSDHGHRDTVNVLSERRGL